MQQLQDQVTLLIHQVELVKAQEARAALHRSRLEECSEEEELAGVNEKEALQKLAVQYAA